MGIVGCKSTNHTTDNQSNKTQKVMTQKTQKQQVTELLKAIETGAAETKTMQLTTFVYNAKVQRLYT